MTCVNSVQNIYAPSYFDENRNPIENTIEFSWTREPEQKNLRSNQPFPYLRKHICDLKYLKIKVKLYPF